MAEYGNSSNSLSDISIFIQNDADVKEAELLKQKFNVPVIKEMPDAKSDILVLCLNADGLSLVRNGKVLRGDFTRMLSRIRIDNLNRELLVKASKIKDTDGILTAIDATAGLGEDSILLAAAGFSVKLYERDPVIAALLRDALRRALSIPQLKNIIERMRLFEADSLIELPKLQSHPDLVLLDPMFPQRQKSALIKKKFQLLQQLEKPCSDEKELLQAAIASQPRKIVIKRPANGADLADYKPNYSIKGKTIRYDCIVMSVRN